MGRPQTRSVGYIRPVEKDRTSSSKYQARRGRALHTIELLRAIVPYMMETEVLSKDNCLEAIRLHIEKVFEEAV